MDRRIYTPLSTREDVFEIRLLRLQPSVDPDATICCSLITYPLHQDEKPHPYEALSYVWGDPNITREITVNGRSVNVTSNLHAALLQLRDRYLERIFWIDALCIDQGNPDEVACQILSMARIYGQASCVLIWLGEEADNSDTALEYIRACGAEEGTTFEETEPTKGLLMRPWFSRIWEVLQEAASARRIQVLCGSIILDGNAFSAGVQKLQPQLPVNHFIRRAAFLSPIFSRDHIRATSNFNRLGNFLDMYHKYSATKRHDKIYALLGMSTGLNEDIKPDYMLPWHQLFRKTIHHILGTVVRVRTWPHREIATISGLGFVLGTVSSIEIGVPDLSRAKVTFSNLIGSIYTLTIPLHLRLIQEGDTVFLLQGASEATVIRPCEDFFQIIAIQVPLQNMLDTSDIDWPEYLRYQHCLTLLWDWEVPAEEWQGGLNHQSLADRLGTDFGEPPIASTKSARTLKIAEILFESSRWQHFQVDPWMRSSRLEHSWQDRQLCEHLQRILDDHRGLLQFDPTAILGLMWKLLVLYAHTSQRHSVLHIIQQALNVQAPAQNKEVWKFLTGFDIASCPSQSDDFENLRTLILDAEVAESKLLQYLLFRALTIEKHLRQSDIDSFCWQGWNTEEPVFQRFLRFRRKELGYTGAIFVCMLVESNTKARDSARLRHLLFESEKSDHDTINHVLGLTVLVQTPGALALRCLLKYPQYQASFYEYEAWMRDCKLLAQRAETDGLRTSKSHTIAPGNADQALDTLLSLLSLLSVTKPTVTEEAIKVAEETISVQGVAKLRKFKDSDLFILTVQRRSMEIAEVFRR